MKVKMKIKFPKIYFGDRLFLIKQKRILRKEQKHLLSEIAKTKKFSTYGGSNEDKIQTTEEWEEKVELRKKLETQLKEVENALAKIKQNKYGKCEKCKAQVETGRLDIFPAARWCVTCTQQK